jgi:uncharacterized protein YbbC (DUF1343 family)
MIKTGLDILIKKGLPVLKGKRVGLICNQASITTNFDYAKDLLVNHKDFSLTCLFAPQHGYFLSERDNMDETVDAIDPETKLNIYSLYSETRQPTKEALNTIDAIVFDIQDVGTRVYTYIWTMVLTMQACKKQNKQFIVLDRPNPINGKDIEGNLLNPHFTSFVGLLPIPMRHGMTVGELALFFNKEFQINCDLHVVKMQGWQRDLYLDQTGLPWAYPSTGLPTLDSSIAYAGMVLFEGTNLSEGRGTTKPFEFIGAPFIEPYSFSHKLEKEKLPGCILQPYYFKPNVNKHASKVCGGIKINITNRKKFKPYLTALMILRQALKDYKSDFSWNPPPYEYEFKKLPIDILAGNDVVRKMLEKGASQNKLKNYCHKDEVLFRKMRKKYLLY